MPLFRQLGESKRENEKRQVKTEKSKLRGKDPDATLTSLCLVNIVKNMNNVWAQDYAQNYMDQYFFRYIMGPFNPLPSELVEELLSVLSSRRLMTRAALHLLLLPQLRHLSLGRCPGLVTANLCGIIGARCQGLMSLDLSGAASVPSPVLSDLLGRLRSLRSLGLAGTLSDARVTEALPARCPSLRHLDVSRCHHLSPAGLLHLSPRHPATSPGGPGGGGLPHLRSLLALDVGFGEEEEDRQGAAAFLLLSLPWLERVALEGLGEACALLTDGGGGLQEVEGFSRRAGIPDLKELWAERVRGEDCGGANGVTTTPPAAGTGGQQGEGEEESSFLLSAAQGNDCSRTRESDDEAAAEYEDEDEDEEEGEVKRRERPGHVFSNAVTMERTRDKEAASPENKEARERHESTWQSPLLTLPLRQVQGVSFTTVGALAQLCPSVCALTLDCDPDGEPEAVSGARVAKALSRWSSSLRSLTLRFPGGALSEMARAVEPVGASLVSLTVEGVRADGVDPLLTLLRSCPQLTTLTIHMEPPSMHYDQEEEEEEEGEGERQQDLQALPCLPRLSCLDMSFSFDPRQKKTVMSWRSLKVALLALLRGSPLLETVTLVAVPCPLDPLFLSVLDHALSSRNPALRHLKHLNLAHSDVSMATLSRLDVVGNGLSTLDLSGCWAVTRHDVSRLQRAGKGRRQTLNVTWM
ncbi:uncharacterized protein LOC134446163 [Engraulis encrasicolus]|uniref:uncharacterized protein LOC134446163 n=1 Tax=Engraulis encrasicolus TaxID=184585 RepID=UPI002FD3274B